MQYEFMYVAAVVLNHCFTLFKHIFIELDAKNVNI